jgi:hypothetical protein
MSGPHVDRLPTHVAHAERGVNRFFGFPVPDLLGAETMTGLVALSVGARRLGPAERAVLDDIAVAMTLADPRIWPLKMARLVASYGGCLPGVAAGLLALQDARIGHFTVGAAAKLLITLCEEAPDLTTDAMMGPLDRRLRAGERLTGFGVPFRPYDERLVLVRRRIQEHGRDQMRYWRTMEAAIGAVRELRRLEPNVGIALAAACLDLGLTPHQISIVCVAVCQTEFLSNAFEGAEQRHAVLRRLPDDAIEYAGEAPRVSPRGAAGGAL